MKDNQSQKGQIDQQIEIREQKDQQSAFSEHLSQYLAHLNISNPNNIYNQKTKQFQQAFESNSIKFHPQKFTISAVSFSIINMGYKEFVEAKVQLGYFTMNIIILNTEEPSLTQNLKKDAEGGFSQIYFCQFFNQSVAIKFTKFKNYSQIKKTIINVVKQFAITKIAAVLGCGPKIVDNYGIQIICFSDGICFMMKQGKKISTLTPTDQQQLKSYVYLLHTFHIIHNDIKPENICRFPKNKIAFIDFGLSDVVSENLGQKTVTNFKGSLSLCGREMQQRFLSQTFGRVDLYFNDSECLINTITSLQNSKRQQLEQIEYQDDMVRVERYYLHYMFKHYALRQNLPLLKDIIKTYGNFLFHNHPKFILESLLYLNNAHQLRVFLKQHLDIFQNNAIYNKIKQKINRCIIIWDDDILLEKSNMKVIDLSNRYIFWHRIKFEGMHKLNDNNFDKLKQMLDKVRQVNENERQQYLQVFGNFMTFQNSRSGLSFNQKAILAKIFKSKVMEQAQSDNQLQNIRQCFFFLLQYYLQLNKKQHLIFIMNIIFQNLIVDNDISHLLHAIQAYLSHFNEYLRESIKIHFHIEKITCFLNLKQKFRNKQSSNKILYFLYKTSMYFKDKSMRLDPIVGEILSKVNDTVNKNQPFDDKRVWQFCKGQSLFKKLSSLFTQIENKQILDIIKKIISFGLLQFFNLSFQVSASMWIFQTQLYLFKKTVFLDDKIQISLGINIIINFYLLLNKHQMVAKICKKMKDLLQCDEIYNSLQLKWYEYPQKTQYDQDRLKQYFFQSIDNIKTNKLHKSMPDFELWKRLFANQHFVEQNIEVITNAIYSFFRTEYLDKQLILKIHIINFYTRGIAVKELVNLPIIKNKLKKRIEESLQQFAEKKKICRDSDGVIEDGESFKYHLIKVIYLLQQQQLDKAIIIYQKLLQFAIANNCKEMTDSCYQNVILLLHHQQNNKKLETLAANYYIFCIQNVTFHSYFFHKNGSIIYITLSIFDQSKQYELLYVFLENLASVITKNFNKRYYDSWSKNIDLFDQYHPHVFTFINLQERCRQFLTKKNNIYLIIYYSLAVSKSSNQKQLLKLLAKISKYFPQINPYAKNMLYERYYAGFIGIESLNHRKRNFLLLKSSQYIKQSELYRKYWKNLKDLTFQGPSTSKIRKRMREAIQRIRQGFT